MSPNVQNAVAVDLTASKKEDLKPTCSLIQKVGPHDDNDLDSSPRPSHHYSTKNQKGPRSHSSTNVFNIKEQQAHSIGLIDTPGKQATLEPYNLVGPGGSEVVPGADLPAGSSKELLEDYDMQNGRREPVTAHGLGARKESHASSAYSADIQSQHANEQNILNSVRSIRSNIIKGAIQTDRSKKESKLAQSVIRIGTGGDNQDHVSTPASLKQETGKASCSNFQLVLQDIEREGRRHDNSQLGRSYNSENRAMSAATIGKIQQRQGHQTNVQTGASPGASSTLKPLPVNGLGKVTGSGHQSNLARPYSTYSSQAATLKRIKSELETI